MSKDGKKCQVYLAGPFFSEEQLARLNRVQEILIHNKTVESYFSPMKENTFLKQPFGSPEWVTEIYRRNEFQVENCSCVLAIVGSEGPYADSGTAFEIGYAVAHKKPVILFQ